MWLALTRRPFFLQTPGLPMQLNGAMFERNGRCGYILKPKAMRFMKAALVPTASGKIKGVVRETLKLSTWGNNGLIESLGTDVMRVLRAAIISGQHLSGASANSLSISVELSGLTEDCRVSLRVVKQTRVLASQKRNIWFLLMLQFFGALQSQSTKRKPASKPIWNEELVFEKVWRRTFCHCFPILSTKLGKIVSAAHAGAGVCTLLRSERRCRDAAHHRSHRASQRLARNGDERCQNLGLIHLCSPQGYRNVGLNNEFDMPLPLSRLFVKVERIRHEDEEPQPDKQSITSSKAGQKPSVSELPATPEAENENGEAKNDSGEKK